MKSNRITINYVLAPVGINNFGNKCVKKYYDATKINTGHK